MGQGRLSEREYSAEHMKELGRAREGCKIQPCSLGKCGLNKIL